jgi:ABC-type protease/lipase transport system fused ATPase/permease subunit
MVRISNRLDVLLSRDVYRASFKRALSSGGMDASAQSLKETLKKTSRFWQNTRIPPAEFPHEADDLR